MHTRIAARPVLPAGQQLGLSDQPGQLSRSLSYIRDQYRGNPDMQYRGGGCNTTTVMYIDRLVYVYVCMYNTTTVTYIDRLVFVHV